MPILNHITPLLGVSLDGNDARIVQVYGTAFSMGGSFLMTAGHCLKAPGDDESLCAAYLLENETGKFGVRPIVEHEILDQFDLGIARIDEPLPEVEAPSWRFEECPTLADVMTSGFPWGYVPDEKLIMMRSFKGYIVARLSAYWLNPRPSVYELSFAAPRGLSGAALFRIEGNQIEVVGIVIGNRSTETVVHEEREVISHIKEETIVKVEAMQLGIAIPTDILRNVECSILGSSIGEHLAEHELCVRSK